MATSEQAIRSTRRSIEGTKASLFESEHCDASAHICRSTFYRNLKRDHRECVVTSAKVDMCDRCTYWDRSFRPKVSASLVSWQAEMDAATGGRPEQLIPRTACALDAHWMRIGDTSGSWALVSPRDVCWGLCWGLCWSWCWGLTLGVGWVCWGLCWGLCCSGVGA